jgi:hypothetical protein
MKMLLTHPIILPRGNATLVLPAHPTQTHPLHNKLDLLLCHLSGHSFLSEEFRHKLQTLSNSHGEQAPKKTICNTPQPLATVLWCKGYIDPISASVENRINFLSELYTQGLSYSAINTARSALSTILLVPDGTTFGNHPLVTRFVKGVFVSRPALPRYTEIWDISLVFNYLRTLHPVEELNLKELTLKTVMLLAILSGQRYQTLHALSITSMERQENKYTFYVNQLLKTSKPGKHWVVRNLLLIPRIHTYVLLVA